MDRLFEIARTFGSDAGVAKQVVRFAYPRAGIVGAAIREVPGEAGTGARISVDPSSNTVLVRGATADMAQIRDLAEQMEIAPRLNPREAVSTSIFRLDYGDAETVARIVQETPQGGADLTNAVVVCGAARQIEEVGRLIRARDVQRPQVMIEADIVEVPGDVAAATDQFGLPVQTLSRSSKVNLLSTPSVMTLDNRPATIVVGRNVPFRTGSSATDGNTLTRATTIERQDVGITMEVLPRVTAGGIVRPDIAQEVLSLATTSFAGAADLVTNRRVITTTVEAINDGTIVPGGLITDDRQDSESKVPGPGDPPILGNAFRARSRDATRQTLFVFMRPRVLTNQNQIQGVARERLGRLDAAGVTSAPPTRLGTKTPTQMRKLPLEIDGLY